MGNAQTKGLHHKKKGPKKSVHWDQAVPPWPPGKPHLVSGSPDAQSNVTIRWDPPPDDGGAPITGYVVEHRKAGTPHWIRTTMDPVLQPELQLSGLEPGWRYQFRVTAENAADLLSDPGEVSQPLVVARSYRPATMAPQFSLELRDAVTLENEKAEFTVHFHGIPTPKIAWYKDSFEIFSSRRMRVTVENGTSCLVIHQSAFTDEGEYKCAATNRVGHIITKAKLRLEAPPRIRIPRQYEDGLLFEKDEVIRLKVSVAGRPLPRTTWYHNGEPIPFGGRYEVSNTDRSSGLRISEAQRSDRGEYQVRATSRLGEHNASFLVTVTDRPLPPGRPDVTEVAGRSVTLSWNEPEDDGGCKIGNYIVEYYRLGWNVWLKAATCRHLHSTLADLIEGSEYKFRVKAENPYGVSEPGCESEIVFIRDPKRGLLEQPVPRSATPTNIHSPNQSADNTREHKHAEDSIVGRHKYREEAVEGERKTGLNWKESGDRKELKREFSERIEEISRTQKEVSEVARRKGKGSQGRADGATPEILGKQRNRNVEETFLESASQSELHSWMGLGESEKSLKASLKFSVAKRRDSSGEHDSGVSEGSFSEGRQNVATSLVPREDDSLLHGSSELMLVLLPQTRGTRNERDVECSSDFGVFSNTDVPPPLSLSAPELGSGEPWVVSPLRNAVSSTELLHEQAMARFYQAVAAEESEKARQGKVVDPCAIPTEAGESSTKVHTRTPEITPKEGLKWHKKQIRPVESSSVAETPEVIDSPRLEVSLKSTLGRKDPLILFTEEEEEDLEDTGMGTVTEADGSKWHSILRHEEMDKKGHKEEKEVKEEEDEMKLQEEDREELSDEEILDDFDEIEELKEDESFEEESSEFDEEEDLYHSIEGEENVQQASDIARFAEQEDETYHMGSMTPLSRASERKCFVHSLKNNVRFQEVTEDKKQREQEVKARELERSPPKSFRDSLPRDVRPLSVYDKYSGSISPAEAQRFEQPRALTQEADVRRKEYTEMTDGKLSMPVERAPAVQSPAPWTSGFRLAERKPNSHITAAFTSTAEDTLVNTVTPIVLAAEMAKQKRYPFRKLSVEEDTDGSRAVADYYGDIIRDYARPKESVRQYLSTTEMKAATSVPKQEETYVSTVERTVPRTTGQGPERGTEPGGETQTVRTRQSVSDAFTAPVPRPRTPRTKSRTPELPRSSQSSTERVSSRLFQQLPDLTVGFSPEQWRPEESPGALLPATKMLDEVTNKKWRSLFSYLADVAMFFVACWLYVFKDERLAIPVLVLMVYRQLHEVVKRKLPKLLQLPWKRSS